MSDKLCYCGYYEIAESIYWDTSSHEADGFKASARSQSGVPHFEKWGAAIFGGDKEP